jgi:endonuclease V-like protein UPF0215 family
MKSGVRALGVAESFREGRSTLAGVVVRANRVVDGFVFGGCTVGGSDATDTIAEMIERLDRPDVSYVLIAGIAPAWFNLLDLHAIAEAADRPTLSVTFEDSEGLESALREAFDGDALDDRLATYHAQPARHEIDLGDETVYVRAVGCPVEEAEQVIRAFTPEGGRPEPLRIARQAARAADSFRREY